jgi:hypothetical protein
MVMAHMLHASCRNAAAIKAAAPLSAPMRRAIEIRVTALEEEQATDIREFDQLYARSNELLLRIVERQQRLRRFREILLARRAA